MFVITERALERPTILRGERVAAVQALEAKVRERHGGIVGDAHGNASIRRFLEQGQNHITWGDFRLDAYPQESK